MQNLLLLSALMMSISSLFNNCMEKQKQSSQNKSSFECGMNPMNTKKMTFCMNTFLISMMFIIFDVEIAFLIPSIFMNKKIMSTKLINMWFMTGLVMVLMKEWSQGCLEWSK